MALSGIVVLAALAPALWFALRKKEAAALPAVPSTAISQRELVGRRPENPVLSAVISRDGKYLAYSDASGIFVQELENGASHLLQGTKGFDVQDWYPDGSHLLVTGAGDLWSLFSFASEKRKLVSDVTSAALSPDGLQILFTRDAVPKELWIVPAQGGDPQVKFRGQEGFFDGFAWSPDGQSIADAWSNNPRPELLEIRSLRDGSLRSTFKETGKGGGQSPMAWLPGGRILLTIYQSRTESDLWALPVDAGKSQITFSAKQMGIL